MYNSPRRNGQIYSICVFDIPLTSLYQIMARLTKYERNSYTQPSATKRNNIIRNLSFSVLMLSTHSLKKISRRTLSTYFLIYLFPLSYSLARVLVTFSYTRARTRTRTNLPSGPLMAIFFNPVEFVLNARTQARTHAHTHTRTHNITTCT